MSVLGMRPWVVVGGVVLGAVLIVTSEVRNSRPVKPIPRDPVALRRWTGKTILLGVGELGPDQQRKQQRAWVGRITRLSPDEGIVIELEDGPPCILPPDLDYAHVAGLSNEVRQKLAQLRPATVGQAARVPGVTPAAVSILLVHLKKSRAA